MNSRSPLSDLARHPSPYVTVSQLASYWQVSRRQLYKHIEAGTLEAIRLGPRLYRIRTRAAIEFEERAQMRTNRAPEGPKPSLTRSTSGTRRPEGRRFPAKRLKTSTHRSSTHKQ